MHCLLTELDAHLHEYYTVRESRAVHAHLHEYYTVHEYYTFFRRPPETINQLKHRLRSCTTGNIALAPVL